MKHIKFAVLLAITLLAIIPASLGARQVWDQPLELARYDNIKFWGTSYQIPGGGYFLFWRETTGTMYHTRYQWFTPAHEPVWSQPLILAGDYISMAATSDGCFIIAATLTHDVDGAYAFKLDPGGNSLWEGNYTQLFQYWSVNDRLACVADAAGGIYYFRSDPSHETGLKLNHLDAVGNRALSSDLHVSTSYTNCYYTMLGLANGNMVLAYRASDQGSRLICHDPELTPQWQFNFPSGTAIQGARLISLPDDSFIMFYRSGDGFHAQRFSQQGQQLWPQELEVGSCAGVSIVSFDAVYWQNDTLLLCYTEAEAVVRVRSLDSLGNLGQVDASFAIDQTPFSQFYTRLSLHRGLSGEVYLQIYAGGLNTSDFQIYFQVVADAGLTLPEEQLVFDSGTLADDLISHPAALVAADGMCLFYGTRSTGSSAIRRISISASGEVAQDPVTVREGTAAEVVEARICRLGGNALVVWSVFSDIWNPADRGGHLEYQIVSPQGVKLLSVPGRIPASGEMAGLEKLEAVSLEDGSAVIVWEQSGPWQLRAQRLDVYGRQKWSEGGLKLFQVNDTNNYQLQLRADGNALVAIMDMSTSGSAIQYIVGQRVENGELCWGPNGKLLLDRSAVQLEGQLWLRLAAPDLILYELQEYGGSSHIMLLRFDQNGDPAPGFPAWGKPLCEFGPPYVGLGFGSALSTPPGLPVSCNLFHGYDNYDVFIQMYDTNGVPQWGGYGYPFHDNAQLVSCDDTGFYAYLPGLEFLKYDFAGNFAWREEISPDPAYTHTGYPVGVVPAGAVQIILFRQPYGDLSHFGFTAEGEPCLPGDHVIDPEGYTAFNQLAEINSGAYVLWGRSAYGGCGSSPMLYLQKVYRAPGSGETPDPELLLPQSVYPNPFTHQASIELLSNTPTLRQIKVSIYNMRGQLVSELIREDLSFGANVIVWDGKDSQGRDAAPGIYFFRVDPGEGRREVLRAAKLR
ncbi:MAG: FlgD immunoglobulin-like domain containing protein [Candidatus Cloacimonetes bacterium]|nr:FlgD immunoglobulin-like domain containing protein [Candidatus Cloacimonadota bacterium]